jgi:PDZ domain/Aspartyl protease
MDMRIFGGGAYGKRRPSLSSVGSAIGAVALAILCWGLAGAQAELILKPQVAPSSQPTVQPEKAKTKAVVPFKMLPTNHMLVEARINDKGPYHLIFDLGAPVTLLSNRVSEATGVVKPGAARSFLFGMRGEAEVDKLQVSELTATKLPVIVLDHPILKALEEMTGRQLDGLMGFTFFARYKTTIDYHARKMTFEPIEYQVRDLLKELPDRLMGPKVARQRVLAPLGLWGLRLGEPTGGLDSPGVPIVEVHAESAAARAGLKPGDVLITLDGRWTTSVADVFHAAADIDPGREAAALIHRDGKEQTITLRPTDGA